MAKKPSSVKPEWDSFEDMPSVYANRVMAIFNGSEFILVFGELLPANIPNVKSKYKKPTIRPMAKIVISVEQMKNLHNTVKDMFQVYDQLTEGSDDFGG